MLTFLPYMGMIAVIRGETAKALEFMLAQIGASEMLSLGFALPSSDEVIVELKRLNDLSFAGEAFSHNTRKAVWGPRNGRTAPLINGEIVSDSIGVPLGEIEGLSVSSALVCQCF
jgi:hypothetical protein